MGIVAVMFGVMPSWRSDILMVRQAVKGGLGAVMQGILTDHLVAAKAMVKMGVNVLGGLLFDMI